MNFFWSRSKPKNIQRWTEAILSREFAPLPRRGFGKAKTLRCAYFYRLFASASIDLSFLRIQHATADTAPFINIAKDKDKYKDQDQDQDIDMVMVTDLVKDKLAAETKNVLANIQSGLKGEGADYPVLRVFASFPGEAKLERTTKPERTTKRKKKEGSKGGSGSIVDLDKHPLAALRLDTFTAVGQTLYDDWFQGNGEQQVVVPSKKRAREEQDSESLVLRKRAPNERGV